MEGDPVTCGGAVHPGLITLEFALRQVCSSCFSGTTLRLVLPWAHLQRALWRHAFSFRGWALHALPARFHLGHLYVLPPGMQLHLFLSQGREGQSW